jgi:hypothetical protein
MRAAAGRSSFPFSNRTRPMHSTEIRLITRDKDGQLILTQTYIALRLEVDASGDLSKAQALMEQLERQRDALTA